MSSTTLLTCILAVVVTSYLIERLLDFLNISRMKPELPASLQTFYSDERYRRSQQYQRETARFGLLGSTLSFALSLGVLLTGGLGWLDGLLRQHLHDPFVLALAFFGILGLVSDVLGMPFALYHTFVIEEKYGFNKTTLKTWILDKVKGWLLTAVLGSAVLWVFMQLVAALQEDFWIWFWIVIAGLTLAIQFLYTSLFLPLFNKLTPLEDGHLRSMIQDYSARVGFPLDNILVMDGSKRSSRANAFFTGFGSRKRIVLFDTLLAQMSAEETLAVLAHEVGHYKRKHIVQGMVIGVLQIGLVLFVLSRLILEPALSEALGATTQGIHLSLVAFALLFSPLSQLTGLAMNLLSRKNEYEADAYARTTYDGPSLERALIKLHVENLSNLEPHPAYVFWHYSHPTLLQRLAALRS